MALPWPGRRRVLRAARPSLQAFRGLFGALELLWGFLGALRLLFFEVTSDAPRSLLCLNQSQLLRITAGHADISAELVIHARLFLNALNDIPAEELSDVQRVL